MSLKESAQDTMGAKEMAKQKVQEAQDVDYPDVWTVVRRIGQIANHDENVFTLEEVSSHLTNLMRTRGYRLVNTHFAGVELKDTVDMIYVLAR